MNEYTILKWYHLSGITDIIENSPINRLKSTPKPFIKALIQNPAAVAEPTPTTDNFVAQSAKIAESAHNLADLYEKMQKIDYITIKSTATNTFTGIGQENQPTAMCIFDFPHKGVDLTNDLSMCPNGVLLQKMLGAIDLSIDTNAFIAPAIAWRLPGDRIPNDSEIHICAPFIKRQIELVQPKILILFGTTVIKSLLDNPSIARARLQSLTFNNIPTFATFGPEMVSTSPVSRKHAWADLQKIRQFINNNL